MTGIKTARAGRAFASQRFFFFVLLLVSVLGFLHGCAHTASSAAAGSNVEPVTASDESETRRRARLRMELAVGYFGEGKTLVALDELKQVLTIDPTFPDAYNLRGLIYMRLLDFRLADESFRKALSLSPKDPDTLHNYGWLLCQQGQFAQADAYFNQALASPLYGGQAKTWLTKGLCQARAGQKAEAERSLSHSLEIDAGNPITGYNLSLLLFERGELTRAQFYIRRINNTELGNAETLWLGIKIERKLNNMVAADQLGEQLKKRYPGSKESAMLARGDFNE